MGRIPLLKKNQTQNQETPGIATEEEVYCALLVNCMRGKALEGNQRQGQCLKIVCTQYQMATLP